MNKFIMFLHNGKKDLEKLIRANLELPVFVDIRKRIARTLEFNFPTFNNEERWILAGLMITTYVPEKYKSLGEVYDYIAVEGDLAEDIMIYFDK